ncbi:concanavalin A-like lectin/glucanase domain-containing protein [Aspergillus pseudonomiae]|uniref:Crh-like protein n=1 Tax=Aspergillus pseudonomiae TaxID=1506151 RepID=A0A5N7DLM4_9EURO|nr:concanavalin A-like lectin/glucanase domain-containing protein [Aspergillus pseudonomiae]KAB8260204.1 concanavalin A-like lectin/glucanase domain-containing protein [Aspergillus pseudonomiae]KAE8407205.1 concanavalin A-like lectin/glucanase domain-containing protein [Aspergillus pseudonomiae]
MRETMFAQSMSFSCYIMAMAMTILLLPYLADAQTFTSCNPTKATCPKDPAFGTSATFDLTKSLPSRWKSIGTVTQDQDGVALTVAKKLDGPVIQSDFYIMFGRVEFTIKAAPGTGIVSSAVLQSDSLDEIDWEWLGGDNAQVQTNYFGKGDTTTYDRGAFHPDPGNHDAFKTYTIDWDSNRTLWQIDGNTVRTLEEKNAHGQYPQTPCFIKVGPWAAGDPSNAQGTIEWAGGQVDYSKGPFTMHVKSIKVTDYSTGSAYEYTDKSGSWKSIKAIDGSVKGDSSGAATTSRASSTVLSATTLSVISKVPATASLTSSVLGTSPTTTSSHNNSTTSNPTSNAVSSSSPSSNQPPLATGAASKSSLNKYLTVLLLLAAPFAI